MPAKHFDLTDRLCLVTGSSHGIGYALAKGLAEYGARVVLNGRDTEKLEQAAADLRAGGQNVEVAAFDVTDPDSVTTGVDRMRPASAPSTFSSTMPACSSARHWRIFPPTAGSNYWQRTFRGCFSPGRR